VPPSLSTCLTRAVRLLHAKKNGGATSSTKVRRPQSALTQLACMLFASKPAVSRHPDTLQSVGHLSKHTRPGLVGSALLSGPSPNRRAVFFYYRGLCKPLWARLKNKGPVDLVGYDADLILLEAFSLMSAVRSRHWADLILFLSFWTFCSLQRVLKNFYFAHNYPRAARGHRRATAGPPRLGDPSARSALPHSLPETQNQPQGTYRVNLGTERKISIHQPTPS
jgi:hypothetical protein